MSLYEKATTKVRVGSVVFDEISAKVEVHRSSVLSLFLFAKVMDEVTEDAKKGVLQEILYADDVVLMSDSTEYLQRKVSLRNATLESKGMKIDQQQQNKTKGKWNKRNIKKQNRLVWNVWQESDD